MQTVSVRPEDLREFAERARGAVTDAKQRYWREVAQREDGLGAFEAGQALYEHAHALGNFPSKAYLAEDLAHHLRLKELIDRASQAIAAHFTAR
jgi:hypothetical protein